MKFDSNCIFCKIADGVIPSYKIYEDDDVLAFLDVNPVMKMANLTVVSTFKVITFKIASMDVLLHIV